ncbi:MAG: flagellin FliC3 [Lachnospiraceae bacterium]|nr:flagellin FliC3 [Lachnospiraceae bacterium]
MRVNYNVSAIIANKALNFNDNSLSNISEKLSTGFKINHAKDNPSGMAIAKRMNLQLRGLSNASQNASDGVSIVQTAEGALQEMQAMVQRLNELAVQSANGTNTEGDRAAIDAEADQLKKELARVAEDTNFNGKKLLNGDNDVKGYTDTMGVKVFTYTDSVETKNYSFTINNVSLDGDGNIDLKDGDVTILQDGSDTAFPGDCTVSYNGNKVTISGAGDFEVVYEIEDPAVTGDVESELKGVGAMRMQIGANEGEVIELRIPSVTLDAMCIDKIDISTPEGATKAIQMTANANEYISKIRARLGAYQNRLEHTENSLDVTDENVTGAYSRIMDTDMAEAMTEYSNLQVLTQAGTSILTQANERPQQVLQLLQ